MKVREWQESSDPQPPAGFAVACTGCRDCGRCGHIPMQEFYAAKREGRVAALLARMKEKK